MGVLTSDETPTVVASSCRGSFDGAVVRAMMRTTLMVAVLVAVLVAAGCSVPETQADGGLLDPLHGPIDPDALDQPFVAAPLAVPEPVTNGVSWRVSVALDGRSLEVYQGLERATVTLGGITTPTGDECLAERATDSLMFITGGGRPIEISPPTALNGRIEDAIVMNEAGDDLAEVMVSLGLARTVGPDGEFYKETEEIAKQAEIGIWSDECDVN